MRQPPMTASARAYSIALVSVLLATGVTLPNAAASAPTKGVESTPSSISPMAPEPTWTTYVTGEPLDVDAQTSAPDSNRPTLYTTEGENEAPALDSGDSSSAEIDSEIISIAEDDATGASGQSLLSIPAAPTNAAVLTIKVGGDRRANGTVIGWAIVHMIPQRWSLQNSGVEHTARRAARLGAFEEVL